MKERQPKPLTKREMLKKLGEETVLEQSHDMVFGYPPMEESNVKPLIQKKPNVKKTEKVDI